MKTLLLSLLLVAALDAAPAIVNKKKPATNPARPATSAPANPTGKIETAVRARVDAYFKDRARMSPAQSVTIKTISTEARAGWAGQYRTSGTVELYVPNAGSGLQKRTFDAFTTVSDSGAVVVTDITGN